MSAQTNPCLLQVYRTYGYGTVRYGPLHQISLVGTVTEEVGGFFPDFLKRLEDNVFLHRVCLDMNCLYLCTQFS